MPEEKKTRYTEAQKAAINKYMKGIAEIKVRMPKEEKTRYSSAASAAGLSVNQFFITAADEKIDRDGLLKKKKGAK